MDVDDHSILCDALVVHDIFCRILELHIDEALCLSLHLSCADIDGDICKKVRIYIELEGCIGRHVDDMSAVCTQGFISAHGELLYRGNCLEHFHFFNSNVLR